MNHLPLEKRVRIIAALVEGNSLRATSRMTGVAFNTVLKSLVDIGTTCRAYHDANVRKVWAQKVQCDEIWSFCAVKDKHILTGEERPGEIGSIWTWTGLDSVSKLMIAYHVGTRDADCACEFMNDLAGRLACRVQMTTDGHKAYLEAVEGAFGSRIDYAMLVKLYGKAPSGDAPDTRYSPAACIGARKDVVTGVPNPDAICTSHVERANLTMRMGMRRFTRLTNGFSKKVENHEHAVALHFLHYNFARVHMTLRVTPAMEAGLCDHVWTLEEIAELVPAPVAAPWGSRNGRRRAASSNEPTEPPENSN